jgi:formamidopyrimidine-DNA glycosylase
MPELPDVTLYVERASGLLRGQVCREVALLDPFVLRTVAPAPGDAIGRQLAAVRRIGKRIVLEFDDRLFFVIHLMIAGRLRWRPPGGRVGNTGLARVSFAPGDLWLTEASAKRRASLHVVAGEAALEQFERGGLEVMTADLPAFAARLRRENHTVKRALTDPRIFSGIGNAYSDEILHAARLSPLQWTQRLEPEQIERLWHATRDTLDAWTARLRAEVGSGFPEKVTAFREGMAVHGRYGQPCPVCQQPVQRIRYASNECNYCVQCQTGGKLLADRGLSTLLRGDWPKTLEELEERRRR